MDELFATNTGTPATAGDGAFERFLTAAIAAIITIMFSWRLLATEEQLGVGEGATGGVDAVPGGQVPKVVMKKAIKMAKAAGYTEESKALEHGTGLLKEGKRDGEMTEGTGVNTVTSSDPDTELITCWENTSGSLTAEQSMFSGQGQDAFVDEGYDGFSRGVPECSDISIDEGTYKPFDPDAQFPDDIQPREIDSDEEMYCATILETIMEEDSDDTCSTSTGSDVDSLGKTFEFGYYDIPPDEDDEFFHGDDCTVHVIDDGSEVDTDVITISSDSRELHSGFDDDSNAEISVGETYDDNVYRVNEQGANNPDVVSDDSNSEGSDESVITVVTRQSSEDSSPVSASEFSFPKNGHIEIVAVRTRPSDQMVPLSSVHTVQSTFQSVQPDQAYQGLQPTQAYQALQPAQAYQALQPDQAYPTADEHAPESLHMSHAPESPNMLTRAEESRHDHAPEVEIPSPNYDMQYAETEIDVVSVNGTDAYSVDSQCRDTHTPGNEVDMSPNENDSGDTEQKVDIVFEPSGKPADYKDAYVSSAVERTPEGFIFSRFELETTDYEERMFTTERPTHTIVAKLVAEEKFVPTDQAGAEIRQKFAELEEGEKVPGSPETFAKASLEWNTDVHERTTKTVEYKTVVVESKDISDPAPKPGLPEHTAIAKRVQSDSQTTAPPEKFLRMDKTGGSRSHRIVPVKKELSVADKLMQLDTTRFQKPGFDDEHLILSKRLLSRGQRESPPEKVLKIGRREPEETEIDNQSASEVIDADDKVSKPGMDAHGTMDRDLNTYANKPTAVHSKETVIDAPGAVTVNITRSKETCIDEPSTTLDIPARKSTQKKPEKPTRSKETCIDDPVVTSHVSSMRDKPTDTPDRNMNILPKKSTSRETVIDDVSTISTETNIDVRSYEYREVTSALPGQHAMETAIDDADSIFIKNQENAGIVECETNIDDLISTRESKLKPDVKMVIGSRETLIDDPVTQPTLYSRARPNEKLLKLDVGGPYETTIDAISDKMMTVNEATIQRFRDRANLLREGSGDCIDDSNGNELDKSFGDVTNRSEDLLEQEEPTQEPAKDVDFDESWTVDEVVQDFKIITDAQGKTTFVPGEKKHRIILESHTGSSSSEAKGTVTTNEPTPSMKLVEENTERPTPKPRRSLRSDSHQPSSEDEQKSPMSDVVVGPDGKLHLDAIDEVAWRPLSDSDIAEHLPSSMKMFIMDDAIISGSHLVPPQRRKAYSEADKSNPLVCMDDGNLGSYGTRADLLHLSSEVYVEPDIDFDTFAGGVGITESLSKVTRPLSESSPKHEDIDGNESPDESGFPGLEVRRQILEQFRRSKSVEHLKIELLEEEPVFMTSRRADSTFSPQLPDSPVVRSPPTPFSQPAIPESPVLSPPNTFRMPMKGSKSVPNLTGIDASPTIQLPPAPGPKQTRMTTSVRKTETQPIAKRQSLYTRKPASSASGPVIKAVAKSKLSAASHAVETNIDDVTDTPSVIQRTSDTTSTTKEKVETTFTSDVEYSPVISAPVIQQAPKVTAPPNMHVKKTDSGRQIADRLERTTRDASSPGIGMTMPTGSLTIDQSPRIATRPPGQPPQASVDVPQSPVITGSPTVTLPTLTTRSNNFTTSTSHASIESQERIVTPMLKKNTTIETSSSVILESPTMRPPTSIQIQKTVSSSPTIDAPSTMNVVHPQSASVLKTRRSSDSTSDAIRSSPVIIASPRIAPSPTILASPSIPIPESPTILASPSVSIPKSPTVLASPTVSIPESPSILASPTVSIPESPSILASPTVSIPESPSILASPTVSIPESPSIPASPAVSMSGSTTFDDSSFEDSSFRIQKKYKSLKEVKRKFQPKNFKSMHMPPTPNIGQFIVPPQAVLTARRRINASRKRFLSEDNLLSGDRLNDQFSDHKDSLGQSTTKYRSPRRPGQRQPSSYSSQEDFGRFILMYPNFFLDESSDLRPSIDELHANCILTPEGRRDIMNKTLSIENLTLDLGAHLRRFGSVTSLVETDIDTWETLETLPFPETDLDVWFELQEPVERAVSMTDLRSQRAGRGRFAQRNVPKSKSLQTLETNLDDEEEILTRTPSVHELRITKSLSKLNIPDWFKNAGLSKSGSCILKHGGSTSTMSSWGFSPSISSSPCPSLTPSANVVIKTRVSPSSSMRMIKAPRFSSVPTLPKTPEEGQMPKVLTKLPSDKFRKTEKPKALEKIPIIPFAKIRAMFEAKSANDKPGKKPGAVRQDTLPRKAPAKVAAPVPVVTVSPIESSELVQLEGSPKRPRSPLPKPIASQTQFASAAPTKTIRPPGSISQQSFPSSSAVPARSISPSRVPSPQSPVGYASPVGSLSPQRSLSPTESPRSLSPLGSLNSSFEGSRSFSPSDKMRPINPDGPHNRSFSPTGPTGARSISLCGNLTSKGHSSGTSSPESPPQSPVEKAGPVVKGGPKGIAGPTVRFVETESLEIKDNKPPKTAGKKDFFKRLQMFQKSPEKDKKTKDDASSKSSAKQVQPVSKLKSAFEPFTRKDNGNSRSIEAAPTLQAPNSKPPPTPPASQPPSTQYIEEAHVIRPPNSTSVAKPTPLIRNVPASVSSDSSFNDTADSFTNDYNSHGREEPYIDTKQESKVAPSRVGNSGQSLSSSVLTTTPFSKPTDPEAAKRNMKGVSACFQEKPQYSIPELIVHNNQQRDSCSPQDSALHSDPHSSGNDRGDDLGSSEEPPNDVTDDTTRRHSTTRTASFEEVLEGLLYLGKRQTKPSVSASTFVEGDNGVCSSVQIDVLPGRGSRDKHGERIEGERSNLALSIPCGNPECSKVVLVHDRKTYKLCQYCYTYYCSRSCRKSASDAHASHCHSSKVTSICKKIIMTVNKDPDLQYRYSQLAKAGYNNHGHGCLLLSIPDLYNGERFLNSPLSSKHCPHFVRQTDLSLEVLGPALPAVSKVCSEYCPTLKYVFCVSVGVACALEQIPPPRSREPVIRKCAKLRLSPVRDLGTEYHSKVMMLVATREATHVDHVDDSGYVMPGPRVAREASFMHIQRTLRNLGVNIRHEFPDAYSKLINFVADGRMFPPQVISLVDATTCKPITCVIIPEVESEIEWMQTLELNPDFDPTVDESRFMSPMSP